MSAPRTIALIADVHAGNHARFGGEVEAGLNRRARGIVESLQLAVARVRQESVEALFVAGDLFDTANPSPQLVAAVGQALGAAGVPVFVIAGNHDLVSNVKGDHALGPLQLHADVRVIERAEVVYLPGFEVLCVPFQTGDARVWLPAEVTNIERAKASPHPGNSTRVLVTHVGVIDAKTPGFLANALDAVPLEDLQRLARAEGIAEVWAGNWHEHKRWEAKGVRVGQVGALVPTGFDNPGTSNYGTAVLLSERGACGVLNIPGARFLTVTTEEKNPELLLTQAMTVSGARPVYVRARCLAGDALEVREDLASWKQRGLVADGNVEVLQDETATETAAEGAAEARKAETFEEALATFTATLTLPPSVERPAVIEAARRYLGALAKVATGGTPGNVEEVRLVKLATHDLTERRIPRRGVVAVTGANGAGKSTLLEGVALALWGESLRDDPPWRAGVAGEVEVTTSRVHVTRSRSKGGKGAVEWRLPGKDPVTFENLQKANAGLAGEVGTFDVWRKTSVLTAEDAGAFTKAADAERKRLLEVFVGLDRLDGALAACRADQKAALVAQSAAGEKVGANKLAHDAAFLRIRDAEAALATVPGGTPGKGPTAPNADLERFTAALTRARADQAPLLAAVRSHEDAINVADAQARQAASTGQSVGALVVCPTCRQEVTAEHKHRVGAEVKATRARAETTREEHVQALTDARAELADLQATVDALQTKVAKARDDVRTSEHEARAVQQAAGLVATLTGQRDAAQATRVAAEAQRAALEKAHVEAMAQVMVLDAVVQVLGTRGVRAHVLTRTLAGLGAAVNRWLARMPVAEGALRVLLEGTTAQANGAIVDVISLRVAAPRDPDNLRGYRSCSGGERRRLDVAFLFALRELAVAAHGEGGTLWVDEVFDALDAQGAQDVASALAELAKERAVVVITHNPALLDHLRPAEHWHVNLDNGTARVETRRGK